jgi:hypothetical protein
MLLVLALDKHDADDYIRTYGEYEMMTKAARPKMPLVLVIETTSNKGESSR